MSHGNSRDNLERLPERPHLLIVENLAVDDNRRAGNLHNWNTPAVWPAERGRVIAAGRGLKPMSRPKKLRDGVGRGAKSRSG